MTTDAFTLRMVATAKNDEYSADSRVLAVRALERLAGDLVKTGTFNKSEMMYIRSYADSCVNVLNVVEEKKCTFDAACIYLFGPDNGDPMNQHKATDPLYMAPLLRTCSLCGCTLPPGSLSWFAGECLDGGCNQSQPC